MSANAMQRVIKSTSAVETDTLLFKEDRPRHIDRFISFFGDEDRRESDVCGEVLLESLSNDHWAER
jgi:hypothetical protein